MVQHTDTHMGTHTHMGEAKVLAHTRMGQPVRIWAAHTCTLSPYVTGFWKTVRNVTLGQLHFLGPANSHTHTLSMHCCSTRLSCNLLSFSRADFVDHVKPQLRQWDPWRALDGRYESDIYLCVLVRRLIGPPGLSRPMTGTSWTHSYSKQSNWVV